MWLRCTCKRRREFKAHAVYDGALGVVLSVADIVCSPTALAMSITFTARPPPPLHITASTRAHMSTYSRTQTREGRA